MSLANQAESNDPLDAETEKDDPLEPLVITCDSATTVLWSWLFSLFCAAGAAYAVYSMTRGPLDWSRDWPVLAAFLVIFPLFAGLMVMGSIWATLRWRKQGVTRLHIPAGYVAEGEILRGSVECGRALQLTGPAKACLECLETRTVRRDGESTTQTRQVISREQSIDVATKVISAKNRSNLGDGTTLAISLPVPELRRVLDKDAKGQGVVSSTARLQWRLTITAPTRGLNHESRFEFVVLSKAQLREDVESSQDEP